MGSGSAGVSCCQMASSPSEGESGGYRQPGFEDHLRTSIETACSVRLGQLKGCRRVALSRSYSRRMGRATRRRLLKGKWLNGRSGGSWHCRGDGNELSGRGFRGTVRISDVEGSNVAGAPINAACTVLLPCRMPYDLVCRQELGEEASWALLAFLVRLERSYITGFPRAVV